MIAAKLTGAAGALVGPAAVPAFLLASSVAGAIGAAWLLARGRGRHATMPYAPALAAGALIALVLDGSIVG